MKVNVCKIEHPVLIKTKPGNSLAVQWLGLHTFTAKSAGSSTAEKKKKNHQKTKQKTKPKSSQETRRERIKAVFQKSRADIVGKYRSIPVQIRS